MRASFALQTLRASSMRMAPRALPQVLPRALHSSSRVQAGPVNPLDDPRMNALREKIQSHEGARDAIMKLGALMQGKGINLAEAPTATEIIKLGMDPEIREAGQNLMRQLQDAGVEINPETASQLFSKVVKPEDEPPKEDKSE